MRAAALGLPLLLALVAGTGPALGASDATSTPCAPKVPASLSGTVWSSAAGGEALLELAGIDRRLEIVELPREPKVKRVHVRLRRDVPGLRIEGFLDFAHLDAWSQHEVSVVPKHVSIMAGETLRLLEPKPGTVVAEPLDATFLSTSGSVECSDLRFGLRGNSIAPPALPKPNARYDLTSKSAPLHDGPNGNKVFQLEVAKKDTVVFHGYEQSSGWVHVRLQDDVIVDGWLRLSDLALHVPTSGLGGFGIGGFGVSESFLARVARIDTDLLLGPSANAPRAAIVDKGMALHAYGDSGEYLQVSVYEEATPPSGKKFYVRAADLQKP